MKIELLLILPLLTIFFNCSNTTTNNYEIQSPNSSNRIVIKLNDAVPEYSVYHNDVPVITPSKLGIALRSQPDFSQGLEITDAVQSSFDETWEQPWGVQRLIRNHYNELRLTLVTTAEPRRKLVVVFRAFDDGVAFRYEFPEQGHLNDFVIMDELTEFNLPADNESWWIGAYQWNRYEYLYEHTPVSSVGKSHTPFTMQTADGLCLSIHEAALTDYASMTLENRGGNSLKCDLVPWAEGDKVRAAAPHVSPWRTIQIADKPGDLITSYLILNLNEPSRITDTNWIQPGKYVGIWWGMHIGTFTWGSGDKHGANNANVKRYIDFAAEHGFPGVLVEGWNTGWDGDWVANGNIFSFTEAHPDFDLPELSRYAAEKGVRIIGHHETSKGIGNYETQVEAAFQLYQDYGINTVKTGYVGHGQNIQRYENGEPTDHLEWHHGQYMVNHYRKVTELAARYGIMLDVHEPIKDTGIRRTWPNLMTREGARGQEFNAWSEDGGNSPDHTTTIPFTRCLAGPFDFTPGIFDLHFTEAGRPANRVSTTLAKQLALYLTIYSPLHMAADLPENYTGQPAFEFIKMVPTDWERTEVLNAAISQYLIIARRDRHSADWFLGSITDESPRNFQVALTFLEPGRTYRATIYADGPHADWDTNPYAVTIFEQEVTSATVLSLKLAPGGGQAIRFTPTD